jgi:hypothetical protein
MMADKGAENQAKSSTKAGKNPPGPQLRRLWPAA